MMANAIKAWLARPFVRWIGLILGAQFLFWGVMVLIGERSNEFAVIKTWEVREIFVAPLDGLQPDPAMRAEARRQTFPVTPKGNCYVGYAGPPWQVSFDVVVPEEALGKAWALYIPWLSDNLTAYLNGDLLSHPRGQFSLSPSREEREPFLFDIPPRLLKAGVNRFDLVVTRKGCTPYMETAYFGPLKTFRAYEAHIVSLSLFVPGGTGVAAWLVAVVALCLLPISGRSRVFAILAVFMGLLGLRSFNFLWKGDGLDYTTFFLLRYLLHHAVLASAAVFVLAWAGRRWRDAVWIGGAYAVFSVAMVWIWATGGEIYEVVNWVLNPTGLILLSAYTAYCLWRLAKSRPGEAARVSILLSVCLTAELYDALVVVFDLRRFITAGYYLPVVVIGWIGAELALRGYELFRAAEMARDSLARQVADKEGEISESYARLREQEALNAIHAERQRLIRDMHDGIGGQLVSLMFQLRGEDLPRETVRTHIQAALDDLRLIIDSMDSVGDSLDVALAIFRERVGPRLKSEGVTLDWRSSLTMPVQGMRPQQILHIYRILQEGVTNILKYAGAHTVFLFMDEDPTDPASLVIGLEDDGKGFELEPQTGKGGRGLSHMRKRARLLDGELIVESVPGKGTRLTLRLPRPPTPPLTYPPLT